MRRTFAPVFLAVIVAGCGLVAAEPPSPPSVEAARAHLDALVEAGIARDFDRLCDLANSGTCESLLDGAEELAPAAPPRVAEVTVHQPQRSGDGFSSGGVLFVLCGTDAAGSAYESQLLVSRNPDDSLFSIPAVWWTGTGVSLLGPADATVGEEPMPGEGLCP